MTMVESAVAPHGHKGDVAVGKAKNSWRIVDLVVTSGTVQHQRAQLVLGRAEKKQAAHGISEKGPYDAIAQAIHQVVGRHAKLLRYKGNSNSEGTDAEGTVRIWVELDGKRVRSEAKSTDTNLAFARAYLGIFNR